MKTFELSNEQVDAIIIEELCNAARMCKYDKDSTLLVSIINVLQYYMVSEDFQRFCEKEDFD